MNNDLDKEDKLKSWISDVKVLVNNLNEYLANPPEGVDLTVTASEKAAMQFGTVETVTINTAWHIEVSATRTEKLI
ncbi:hypothetical protein LGN06_07920 [Burkholderia vietnamiensis]|uniref:hypothetical protein n=1 Tax=Burkholderia vietnamiensis TaxID=60552 RepID=UPI001CF3DFD1|nr:hypothetical protein [Burkholderia vietnamiensis]MCA8391488.1 hypothetical protein [Burkholderia vietnamiensis]HDR8957045.1 hypothetical protein [Burkholderia vietnamiensis]HDR9243674.1 hypothetical protein [Burkholderia vietnamiensis]